MNNKFVIGEYKTTKRDCEFGVRTFKVEKISRKNMKVLVSGAINGVYDLREDYKGVEFIALTMDHRLYLNPSATDILK